MRNEFARSFPVSIFIAGDPDRARKVCADYCDAVGLCVTVTPTTYVYTGGEEAGVIVALINYPRFPADPPQIEAKAIELGMRLREALGQESFSVQTPITTTWFSWRAEDCDSRSKREAPRRETGSARKGESGGSVRKSPKPHQDTPHDY